MLSLGHLTYFMHACACVYALAVRSTVTSNDLRMHTPTNLGSLFLSHLMMNAAWAMPSGIWCLICLFLVPIDAMPLLRISRLVGKRLGRSILYNFERFLIRRLKDFIPFPHDFLDLLSDCIAEGVAKVIVSGSSILEGLQYETYGGDLDLYCVPSMMPTVYQHLVNGQHLELISMFSKRDLGEYAHLNNLNSIWNFAFARFVPYVVQLIVVENETEPVNNVVLGFDFNVVKNSFDGVNLFCAAPGSVHQKRVHLTQGREMKWGRVEKYLKRGYTFVNCLSKDHITLHMVVNKL